MVLRPVSVQYIFLDTQSTARPSVVFRPWLTTVSIPLPSRLARLEEEEEEKKEMMKEEEEDKGERGEKQEKKEKGEEEEDDERE